MTQSFALTLLIFSSCFEFPTVYMDPFDEAIQSLHHYIQKSDIIGSNAYTLEPHPGIEVKRLGKKTLQELVDEFMKAVKKIVGGNDPISFNKPETHVDNKLVVLDADMNYVSLSGQGSYSLKKLVATEDLHFEIELGFNKTFEVFADGDLYFNILTLFPVYGKGMMGIDIKKLNLSISMDLFPSKNSVLQLKLFKMDYFIGNMKVNISNLMGGKEISDFLNGVISDCAVPILMDYKNTLLILLNSVISRVLNKTMMEHSITLAMVEDFMQHIIDITPQSS